MQDFSSFAAIVYPFLQVLKFSNIALLFSITIFKDFSVVRKRAQIKFLF